MVQIHSTNFARTVAACTLLVLGSLSLLPAVQAHGQIKGVLANGIYNQGPNIYYDGDAKNTQTAVRTMYKSSGPSYNLPPDFSDDAKMACESASGAPKTIQVTAGSDVRIDWVGATSELLNKAGTGLGLSTFADGEFPWVHAMGTVATYIAPCTNGDCTTFDAASASWVKLQLFGLDMSQSISDDLRNTMKGKPEPYSPAGNGLWGMAKFVAQGSSWTVTIPAGLKNGQYLVRHELIAMHNPLNSNPTSGPQQYVGCIQFEVIGGGDKTLPEGTKAGSLYASNGDFAKYNIYSDEGKNFVDPGPAVWDGASASSSSSSSTASSSSSGSSATSGASSDSGSSSSTLSSSDTGSSSSDSGASTSAAVSSSDSAASASTSAAATASSATSVSGSGRCRKRSVSSVGSWRMTRMNSKRGHHMLSSVQRSH